MLSPRDDLIPSHSTCNLSAKGSLLPSVSASGTLCPPRLPRSGGNRHDLVFHELPCLRSTLHAAAGAIRIKGSPTSVTALHATFNSTPTRRMPRKCHSSQTGHKTPRAQAPHLFLFPSRWSLCSGHPGPPAGTQTHQLCPSHPSPGVPSASSGILPLCLYSRAFLKPLLNHPLTSTPSEPTCLLSIAYTIVCRTRYLRTVVTPTGCQRHKVRTVGVTCYLLYAHALEQCLITICHLCCRVTLVFTWPHALSLYYSLVLVSLASSYGHQL